MAVIGGGIVGCETTEYLAEQGYKVSIVDMAEKIAKDVGLTVLPTMLELFKEHGVEQFPEHKVTSIQVDELNCENKEGKAVKIPCDFVVMASGSRPVKFDTAMLTDRGISVVKVGDCLEVANISRAIKTGYDAANAL